ncbi:hypothetical protein A2U01_0054156, partial [Trifolium medium]|nr:hypothetical protein [Trifolium medium]
VVQLVELVKLMVKGVGGPSSSSDKV